MQNNQTAVGGPNLAMRLNETDKATLMELSHILGMNQTETVRYLIRQTMAAVNRRDVTPAQPMKQRKVKKVERTAGGDPKVWDEVLRTSPAMLSMVAQNIQAAEDGEPEAKQWVERNVHYVQAYARQFQNPE